MMQPWKGHAGIFLDLFEHSKLGPSISGHSLRLATFGNMAVSNLPSSAPWHTENITEHYRTSQNITAFVNSFLILCFEHIYVTSTSSSAQGGGGSFKDRKTIGEVSDCDLFIYLAS